MQAGRLTPRTVRATDPDPVLPRPERIATTLGFRNLLADWYWLQYVQYFGDSDGRRSSGYGYAAAYLELITALNPQFLFAYTQANHAVAEAMGEPERAVRFLEAGARRNPGRPDALAMPGTWYLYRLAGSVVFRHFRDYRRAGELFARAASEPGAPAVMKENAAAFFAAANDRERAIGLWLEFLRLAPTEAMRAEARRHLGELGVDVP